MADEEPVYQFLVTSSEMKLLHTLRAIAPEEETEENQAKLRSAVHLMAYAGDRHLGDFSVDGSNLVTGCAEVGAQIRDRILNDKAESVAQEDANVEEELATASTTEAINDVFMDEPIPWDEVRSQAIPSYVNNVMFTVSKDDLNDERRKELAERFPDVIVQESGSNRSAKRQAAPEHPDEKPAGVKNAFFELNKDCSTIMEADIRNRYPWVKLKPSTHTLIQQVLEGNVENQPPAPTITSPTVVGPCSMDSDSKPNFAPPTEPRGHSLVSRVSWETQPPEVDLRDFDMSRQSDVKDLCQRLGLENVRADYIASIYVQWERRNQIRSYTADRMILQYYYVSLVDMYALAHARKDHALEHAILLQFQTTNFEQPEEIPYVRMSVGRAFKNLPVEAPLCQWIAVLYSYERNSLHEGDYDSFLRKNKAVDPDVLGKFLYQVAVARNPPAARGQQELLERWCSIHHHVPYSDEDYRCMKAERNCRNILSKGNSSNAESVEKQSKKRSLEPPIGYSKKFKPNDAYQHGRLSSW